MIKDCPVCGTTFVADFGRKYCSYECSYEMAKIRAREAHRSKKSVLGARTCSVCGKEYYPTNRNQKYCSQNCNPDVLILQQRACKWCGTLFMPTDKSDRFCSVECEDMHQKSREVPKKYDPDQVRKRRMETAKIVAKARKQGVSYGYYV